MRLLLALVFVPAVASAAEPKPTLDCHGWGDLQPRLHRMTKEGRWGEMIPLITDEMLDTIAVTQLSGLQTCLVCPERWGRPEDIPVYQQQMDRLAFRPDAVMTADPMLTPFSTTARLGVVDPALNVTP